MDEGFVSVTGSGFYDYVSRKQTGMLKLVTKINMAHVCLSYGYVELYLDPNELKKKLS